MEPLVDYLKANPVVVVGIGILVLLCGVSLVKKLIKLALVLLVVMVVALYFVRDSAMEHWDAVRAEAVKKAGERAREMGQKAVAEGRKAVEEGKKAIENEVRKEVRK